MMNDIHGNSRLYTSISPSGMSANEVAYISEGGVRKVRSLERGAQQLLTFSAEADVKEMERQTGIPAVLAPSYQCYVAMIHAHPEISARVGLSPDGMLEAQEITRKKYKMPLGVTPKLFAISSFKLEFIIDDSYSMDGRSSRTETRWQEAQRSVNEMVEIFSSIPTGPIEIRFLNQPHHVIRVEREGKTPEKFLEEIFPQINAAFARGTQGSTPVFRVMKDAYDRYQKDKTPTAHYLFGDGVPDGGESEVRDISNLVTKRSPWQMPLFLNACSNNSVDVEWMNEVEEVAEACSAMDDFIEEQKEVRGDQGAYFPYNEGLFHGCRMVGALFPNDLDAMDEGTPFTKCEYENLFGLQISEQEFRLYYDGFCQAQERKRGATPMDNIKKNFPWASHYNEFLSQDNRNAISCVHEYKEAILRSKFGNPPTYAQSKSHPPVKSEERKG